MRVQTVVAATALAMMTMPVAAHGTRHTHRSARIAYHHAQTRSYGARVLQCVAFARNDTGIELAGNARDWWENAAGVYARGGRPEVGSVLAFRPVGRMPLGHVAVVSATEDSRTILIDQSHWGRAGVTRATRVVDVSDNNDWSAVRVQLSRDGAYGSIYPTHGFIYPRPDDGRLPVVLPAVVRSVVARPAVEVAEAPARSRPLDLSIPATANGTSFATR